ncbi:MAG: AAA family ATPase [Bacteroidales bacterium]|nr:AAA family ATPase [Candidatus Latescibacterota bacterium]
MKRQIEKQLLEWKDSGRRKPLILRGARQVGKTWSVKSLGSEHFENTVHMDLEKNRNFHSLFDGDLDPAVIVRSIEVLMNTRITSGKTLLFLDEIQSCPRALMSLRYFYEEMPELHVIAAGSLLEFALGEISFPVGRIQYLHMAPMSFLEYLEAGENDRAVEIIRSRPEKLQEPIHTLLLQELKTYFLVGGMPESVKTFYQTGSLMEPFKIHKELIHSFKDDFGKYATHSNKDCLDEVFANTSRSIGNQLAYSGLSNSFSHPTIRKAFELLVRARMINKVSSVGKLELPLDVQSSSRKFKAIMLDIGVWQLLSGISIENEIAEPDLMNLYRGALAEQYVGQELAASTGGDLHYWARSAKSSTAEIDYIVTVKGKIYPIEVKSGSSGSLKSLHLALNTFPDCPGGIVFSTREYGEIPEQKLTFLPLYYAGQFLEFL